MNDTGLASLVAELAGLVVIIGGFSGAMIWLSRLSRQWQKMQDTLSTVLNKVQEIISDKEKEHAEMRAQILLGDQRLRDHEKWHMESKQ